MMIFTTDEWYFCMAFYGALFILWLYFYCTTIVNANIIFFLISFQHIFSDFGGSKQPSTALGKMFCDLVFVAELFKLFFCKLLYGVCLADLRMTLDWIC